MTKQSLPKGEFVWRDLREVSPDLGTLEVCTKKDSLPCWVLPRSWGTARLAQRFPSCLEWESVWSIRMFRGTVYLQIWGLFQMFFLPPLLPLPASSTCQWMHRCRRCSSGALFKSKDNFLESVLFFHWVGHGGHLGRWQVPLHTELDCQSYPFYGFKQNKTK